MADAALPQITGPAFASLHRDGRPHARLGGPDALQALRAGLQDKEAAVQEAALRTLADFGNFDAADDLLKRVSAATEDRIAACTASPVRDRQAPTGVRRTPSPVSMKAVYRCLEEIGLFAEWAINHNYRRLAAF